MSAVLAFPALEQRLEAVAPAHPPCFEGRQQWVIWLSLAHASGDRDTRSLLGTKAAPAFNAAVNFCTDCEAGSWRSRMVAEGRCQPYSVLKDMA